ncbi:hypothetical protein KBX71_12000 [Micromonospora sp. D93]|uniref:hypothetical protein n=1 Tax=Micromonospora sp. D93 TaxID=2824886 RepID=UPI001B3894A9|nr:hypothetical protein [Micromonospora sp. D93]MBQ1018579.1 hypothetical protein [Micromonospora sp. D93]
MRAATWRMVVLSFPGPVALAVWLLVTVPGPLVFFEWTHRCSSDRCATCSAVPPPYI